MEAVINRTSRNGVDASAARSLRGMREIGRRVLGAVGYALVHYSRAAMLLRGGNRPFRRM